MRINFVDVVGISIKDKNYNNPFFIRGTNIRQIDGFILREAHSEFKIDVIATLTIKHHNVNKIIKIIRNNVCFRKDKDMLQLYSQLSTLSFLLSIQIHLLRKLNRNNIQKINKNWMKNNPLDYYRLYSKGVLSLNDTLTGAPTNIVRAGDDIIFNFDNREQARKNVAKIIAPHLLP